jgi:hypothetical protein
VMFEEVTQTLLCGDLFTHVGGGAPVTEDDLVERSLETEALFRATSCLTAAASTLRPSLSWGLAPWRSCTARLFAVTALWPSRLWRTATSLVSALRRSSPPARVC